MKLTDKEWQKRHDQIVKAYPGGMTAEQYRRVVLESADEDGTVYPHSLANWFHQQSILMSMLFDGLLCTRNRWDEPFDWHITDKGRSRLRGGEE